MSKTKYLIFGFGVFLSFLTITKCEICKKRVNLQRWVPETFYRTVRETYRGRCFFRCTKTRINSYYDERMVLKTTFQYIDECCNGYTEDHLEIIKVGHLQCKAICSPACQQGFCQTPGLCVCYEGYERHRTDEHKCLPICSNGCEHGTCVRPDVCECNFGYELRNHSCQPICTDPCLNATCVAPDTCECLSGYRKTDNNLCLPYCSSGCTNGVCLSPENCSCNDGWYKVEEVCAPHCDLDCGGGTCISPNVCQCRPDHIKSPNGTCVPHCSQGCINGNCVSPENCVCNEGWIKSDQLNMCLPYCEMACGGGNCSHPNVCECFSGYMLSDNGTCLPHCPEGCPHGQCVLPENCSCENGWYKNQTDNECYPICNEDCNNGICVEPNKCECNSNYTMIKNGSCIPYCSTGCPDGICLSPEVCECNAGWQNNEVGICEPHCKNACGNGTCIEPDVCECWPGFKFNADNDLESMNALCVPECLGCNGTCLAPEHCACEIPFEAVVVTEDGQKCDCDTNCSEGHRECHHIACVYKDAYYISTTDIISYSNKDEIISTTFGLGNNYSDATDNVSDDVTNLTSSTSSYNTDALRKGDSNYGIPSWVYIMVSSIITVLVILSITICSRKVILHYCKGSSYVITDEKT